MTHNRMGSTRRPPRPMRRKALLTGTLALGAVAASGAVASAALHHPSAPQQKLTLAGEQTGHTTTAAPSAKPAPTGKPSGARTEDERPELRFPHGPVCLRLDAKAQKVIADAEAAAKAKGAVVVPMGTVQVVPCPRVRPVATKPVTTAKTTPAAPAATPTPTVSSTAS